MIGLTVVIIYLFGCPENRKRDDFRIECLKLNQNIARGYYLNIGGWKERREEEKGRRKEKKRRKKDRKESSLFLKRKV